jgi:hypothetical protein
MYTFAGSEGYCAAIELKRRAALEDEEVLASLRVKVLYLSTARRNALLNDTKIRMLEKMPPVAPLSPCVVLGIG